MYSAAGLAKLSPSKPGGAITPGTQTHPADGTAGAIVTSRDKAQRFSDGQPVARILSAAFARARMPKEPALAAHKALAEADKRVSDLKAIAELAQAFVMDGGGLGLFTGCAAGDMGAAVVIEVH